MPLSCGTSSFRRCCHRCHRQGYLAWPAVGLPVASMGLVGWEDGYEVGGVVLALIGVGPAVLTAWAFLLLWRHRKTEWREHEHTEPD